MSLAQILSLVLLSAGLALLGRRRGRDWGLLLLSLLALYWLQPATTIRQMDFWLPSASLLLTALVWLVTLAPDQRLGRQDGLTLAVVALVLTGLSLSRGLDPALRLSATAAPRLPSVLLALALGGVLCAALARWRGRGGVLALGLALLGLFLVLKTEALGLGASRLLRRLTGQDPALAASGELVWLGYSYLAFRLLHVLRDRSLGRLPRLDLRQFLIYALFFPALAAGPIDRVERFVEDLRRGETLDASRAMQGAGRILWGVFKKFALADSLGLVALNPRNAPQVQSAGWLWLLLYAFALQLYLDFSGYTDVALGLGIMVGVRLPENFRRPYLAPNLTAFWNRWHITLAQWFRAYFFNPLTRALRKARRPLPIWAMVLVGQVSTMALIGLWHGVSWSFLLWGLWHGLGLFIHNRWGALVRARPRFFRHRVFSSSWAAALRGALTFHYVTLGWVWFVLPDPALAWATLVKLVGG